MSVDMQNISSNEKSSKELLQQSVTGSRRPSNLLVGLVVTIGGIGFSLASLSSYFGEGFLPIGHPEELIFVPQGLVMGVYGILASLLAVYIWALYSIDFGGGINRFDKAKGVVLISRRGYLKDFNIELPLNDVKAVRLELRDGVNPRRRISLRVNGRADLPLTRVGDPIPISQLEQEGAELARFLGVSLEGI